MNAYLRTCWGARLSHSLFGATVVPITPMFYHGRLWGVRLSSPLSWIAVILTFPRLCRGSKQARETALQIDKRHSEGRGGLVRYTGCVLFYNCTDMFIMSKSLLVESVRPFNCKIIPSASPCLFVSPFLSFSFPGAPPETSTTALNKSNQGGHSFLFPGLKANILYFPCSI